MRNILQTSNQNTGQNAMRFAVLMFAFWASAGANASPLVYTPLNPAFGGNPSNGIVMLNEAQAQDQTKAPAKSGSGAAGGAGGAGSAAACPDKKLCAFQTRLQSAILSRLSADIVGTLVKDGNVQPGTIDTINFLIDAIDLGGGQIQVSITSKATGQTETFVVDQGEPLS